MKSPTHILLSALIASLAVGLPSRIASQQPGGVHIDTFTLDAVRRAGSDQDVPIHDLQLIRMIGDSASFGFVTDMAVVGNSLLVADGLMVPRLVLVDLVSGEVARRFGNSGQGPGEFAFPRSLAAVEAGAQGAVGFRVYDPQNRRLSWYRFAEGEEPRLEREETVRVDALIQHLHGRGGQPGYVGSGLFGESHALIELDTLMEVQRRIWIPPAVGPRELDHGGGLIDLNLAHLAVRPGSSQAVVVYQEVNHIVFVDLEHGTFHVSSGPSATRPVYEVRDGNFGFVRGEHEMAYVGVEATGRYVYALFCGCAFDVRAGERSLPHEVHVFDWRGNVVAALRLDRRVTAIEPSSDDTVLWAYFEEPIPLVGEWRLPARLAEGGP